MNGHIENAHDWVDEAISATGMSIEGKHTLEPRKKVVIAAVAAHEAYLWGKAEQAIGNIQEPVLQDILRNYTEVLLGKKARR